ncbi:hypothetical protein B0J11DRAFT_275581 [Dendryphion nanum]|uniref:Zn(2)-C6 fungal-type domain-containing protein n=1 Tax=Dendryphion nanum TaxID=256645 RepID=A0A9P9IN44_9PLEO|nr:hypothetical protein B0J11DRAFT_275581 [Dendryphion nanum]
MVNPGRPSRGCMTCRRRRVKCDETRPKCNRCIKLSTSCEWRDDWSNVFRDQEQWAEKKVEKRVERAQNHRKKQQNQLVLKSPAHVPKTKHENTFGLINPLAMPQIGAEVYAISQFFVDYGFLKGTCPFTDVVYPLYDSQNAPECLKSILPAVALASIARQTRRYELMQEAQRQYGRSLKRLAHTLSDPVALKHDATLATVYMLSLYEMICFDSRRNNASPYETHGAGRLAILRLRGRDQFMTLDGANLFLITYLEQLIGAVETRSGEVLEDAPEWISQAFEPPRPIVSHAILMHDISVFLKELKDATLKEHVDYNRLEKIFRRGIEIDTMASELQRIFTDGNVAEMHRFYESMDTWRKRSQKESRTPFSLENHADNSVSPALPRYTMTEGTEVTSTMDNSTSREDYFVPEMDAVTIFLVSVTTGTLGNMCRATHMHLLQDLLGVIPHIASGVSPVDIVDLDLKSYERKWNSIIAASAIEIYDHIPYAFGECGATGEKPFIPVTGMIYRAYLSLWPICTALNAPQTPHKYKNLLATKLMRMSDIMGIGMAGEVLANAERDATMSKHTEEDAKDSYVNT